MNDDKRDLIQALESLVPESAADTAAAPAGMQWTTALGVGIAPPRVVFLPSGTPTDAATLKREARKAMQAYRALKFTAPSDTGDSGAEAWEKMVSSGVPRYRPDGSIERVSLAQFQNDLMPEEMREHVRERPPVENFSPESAVYRRDIKRT